MNPGIRIALVLCLACVAVAVPPASGPSTMPARWAVPDAAARLESTKAINEVYGDEIAKARKPEDRAALARKLLPVGTDSRDIANRYVLLEMARDLAADGGDANTAMGAIDEMARTYAIDPLAAKSAALARLAKGTRGGAAYAALALKAGAVVDEAVLADRYDVARELADQAVAFARFGENPELLKQSTARAVSMKELADAFADVKPALIVLEHDPAEPTANLAVGRFHCFARNDWERGLPYLANCGDVAIKQLAADDLADPTDADKQVALADGWWNLVARLDKELYRRNVQQRSAKWYREALPDLSGLARARVTKRLELIPSGNDTAIAAVKQGGKWGFIDRKGKFVVPAKLDFTTVGPLREGLAVVTTGDPKHAKYGYIDAAGRTIIPPQFDLAYPFSSGLALVHTGDRRSPKRSFVDKTGRTVIGPFEGMSVYPFREGLALVHRYEQEGRKHTSTFYDPTGRKVLQFPAECVGGFIDGVCMVRRREGTVFINRSGQMALDVGKAQVQNFSQGLAPVAVRADKDKTRWGFIDKTGKPAIEAKYEEVEHFSDGLAAVRLNAKWGFVDKTGRMVIEPQYDEVGPFREGLAMVRLGLTENGKSGYIDKTGAKVIPVQFELASDFGKQ